MSWEDPTGLCYRGEATALDAASMRDHIAFVVNGELQTLRAVPPSTTLLSYLRRTKRLTGTKEGCAEGDCGACTVVVGELREGAVHHRAVNACILLLPMLEGRSVVTVEHLQGEDGAPHPVQQALADGHGSQCGFCTPGFVMSLYAAYLGEPKPDAGRIDDILAGNLCRCTGYGPIVRAAQAMYDVPRPAAEQGALAESAGSSRPCATPRRSAWRTAAGASSRPQRLHELARLYEEHPQATILSGATDVGLWITKLHRDIATFIHIGRVRELQAVTRQGQTLRIGAGATWSDLEEAARRALSRLRRVAAALRLRAGAQCRAPSAATSPTARPSATARRR